MKNNFYIVAFSEYALMEYKNLSFGSVRYPTMTKAKRLLSRCLLNTMLYEHKHLLCIVPYNNEFKLIYPVFDGIDLVNHISYIFELHEV